VAWTTRCGVNAATRGEPAPTLAGARGSRSRGRGHGRVREARLLARSPGPGDGSPR
jgi:hypothetical protein